VITQPDRRAGRGRRPILPPVKERAQAAGLPLLQPEDVNGPEAVERIREVAPDAMVVAAYGSRLGREVLALPRLGCYNIHASLLPRHRGASPVNFAILSGDAETGVTVQRMVERIDAGPVLARRTTSIGDRETAGELSERLAGLAAEMIVPVLDAVEQGSAREEPQDESCATYAPRLTKADGCIPWEREAEYICRFVRAMTPWPGAFTFHRPVSGRSVGRLLVLAAQPADAPAAAGPGVVVRADEALVVAAGEGFVSLLQVKPEGGRPMDAAAFLRGRAVRPGDRLGRE